MLNAAALGRRILEVDDLSFGYGDGFRLEGISFTVEARSFTALLGPNGAGKTTLFSAHPPVDSERGSVRIQTATCAMPRRRPWRRWASSSSSRHSTSI